MTVVGNDISRNEYKSAYLLCGEEAYLRNYYKNSLKKALVSEGDTLNYAYFEGTGTNPDEVAGLLLTMPFMAEHRVVIVENSGWFAKAGGAAEAEDSDDAGDISASDEASAKNSGRFSELLDAIANMDSDVIVIFSEEKTDKRSKLYKAILKKGTVEEYSIQNDDQLARWLVGSANASGKRMDSKTAYYLVSEVGTDMMLLSNELDKLIAFCLDKDSVTINDVDFVCTHQVNNKIFDMITAISTGRRQEALKLYYDLLTLRESAFAILALLVRQYMQLLTVRDLLNNGQSVAGICARMGIKDWLARRLTDVCRNLSRSTIVSCLEACAKADADIKNGNITDTMSIELLIVELSDRRNTGSNK